MFLTADWAIRETRCQFSQLSPDIEPVISASFFVWRAL
jgi:hypothetical protein